MPEASSLFRRSPLNRRLHLQGVGGTVRIGERPFVGKFILRAEPSEVMERLRQALGLGLPFDPLTSATTGETSLLWMGPDEWMLVTAPGEGHDHATTVREALAGTHHQLVDVSDYYTIIEVAGRTARELLMKLTTLDLHPRAFRAGMVTGSLFGRANALIWQTAGDASEEGPAFSLFIRWSMADYLWCAIASAGREWGVPEEIPVKGERLTVE